MLAPAAYQNGPLIPNWYATVEDWSSVAAHVHAETTEDAIRPVFTLLPAVENHSKVFLVPSHLVSALTSEVTARAIIKPTPRRIRYPIPSERTIIHRSCKMCHI